MHGREKFLTPTINSASSIINVSLGPATGSSFSGGQIPAVESVVPDRRLHLYARRSVSDDKLVSCCECEAAAAAAGDPLRRLH